MGSSAVTQCGWQTKPFHKELASTDNRQVGDRGFRIPFLNPPVQAHQPNPATSSQRFLIQEEVSALREKGAIINIPNP